MSNRPVLSICIPTNGIVEWVVPVIESIYSQQVDHKLFEVVVTDNGGDGVLEKAVAKYDYDNFFYYKTSSSGFLNQIDAFERCHGEFCKMLNHRSKMRPGSIEALLSVICKYIDTKPILYCAEGVVKGDEFIECNSVDEFVKEMNYWVSWSAGTGVWRSDVSNLRELPIDKMFPHTVFLFGLRKNSKYVIWNGKYEDMADETGKGGYDLFRTFGVNFLDIISNLRIDERISLNTFLSVKEGLYGFLCSLYFSEVLMPSKRSFIIQNIRESMSVYYGDYYYYKMVFKARLRVPMEYLYNFFKTIKRHCNG